MTSTKCCPWANRGYGTLPRTPPRPRPDAPGLYTRAYTNRVDPARLIADGQDALGVAQVILVKSRGRFTGRGGWAYALVQRVDGEEDEFEFASPVLLFIVRD